MHNRELTSAKWGRKIKIASGILSVSIILSTIFIKQHSLFDVATGILMGSLLYLVVYRKEWLLAGRPEKKNNRTPQAG